MRFVQTAALCVLASLAVGCARTIDRFAVERVVDRALAVPDVDQACGIGRSLRSPLASLTSESRPARQALLIAEFTSALCDEMLAQRHELDAAMALSAAAAFSPQQKAALVKDARLAADRAHTRAAQRFQRALEHGTVEFGAVGGECPRLKSRDELAFMLMLVAGLQVVVHDSAAGSPLGVPKETALDVARSAQCLDDERWWFGPSAMKAAAWATIPGSAPEGTDPWALLADVAEQSDGTGIRVARALQVQIAVNAGRDDLARTAIAAHAAAIAATPASEEFALFDRYALNLSRHQSDLFWIAEAGHRTPVFGELPAVDSGESPASGTDPFAGDPFAEDPFSEDPFGGDATDVPDGEAPAGQSPPSNEDSPEPQ